MTSWATPAQAKNHWADATKLDDVSQLQPLLDAATIACRAYAPALRRHVTATTTQGSPSVTLLAGADFDLDLDAAAPITGTGIPANTTVSAVLDPWMLTLSANATATSAADGVDLVITRPVPVSYMLATIYQARELRAAIMRGETDIIGVGDFAIRARPLTAAVKQLLRPQRRAWTVG